LKRRLRVVITDAEYESHEIERNILSEIGAELSKFQCKTDDDIIKYCSHADGLLNQYAPITANVITNLKDPKVIARYGIGVDNIDVSAATEKGIFVTNAVYDTTDVAEHTVALILSLVRKIPWANEDTKNGEWDWKRVQPISRLRGKTVGILGFGRIGRQVARRLEGFEVKLISSDPYVPPRVFEEHDVQGVDFEKLIKESDIITIHVPLTNETRQMIGASELRKMKMGALMVNVARGGVIDEKALYSALKQRWISGAALDVLEKEPMAVDNPLIDMTNVIVTPHMAWYSVESIGEIQRSAAEQIAQALTGRIPTNLVNKEVLKRIS